MPFDCLWSKPKQNKLGQKILEIGKSWKISLMAAICGNRSKQNSVINDFKGRQHRNNSFICSKQVLTFPHSEQVKRIPPSRNSSFHHHFIIIIIIINIDISISLSSCHSAHWNFIPFSCLQERKTWLKNTRKARFSRDSNELRLFKVSRLFIYFTLFSLVNFEFPIIEGVQHMEFTLLGSYAIL